MAMPDQKAEQIVRILKDHIFTVVGPPERLHLWFPSIQYIHLDWCGVTMQEVFTAAK